MKILSGTDLSIHILRVILWKPLEAAGAGSAFHQEMSDQIFQGTNANLFDGLDIAISVESIKLATDE